MLNDLLQMAVILNILAATIRMATPLLLGAMGELVAERSGVMNMGLEGMMLFGVFIVWLVTYLGGSTITGIGFAMIVGGLLGLLLAVLVIFFRVDQTVSGLAINLLAVGVGEYIPRMVNVQNEVVQIDILANVNIPILSEIPIVGEILFQQNPFTYLAFISVPIVAWFLKKTKYGLAIRSAGENPKAVDTRGLNVNRIRTLSTVFAGMMAGLGGAFLMSVTSRYLPEMTAGRGWLAIIVVIAGNWKPSRMVIATLLFAFLSALQVTLTTFEIAIPYEFFLIMPYVLALVALAATRVRSAQPAKLGVPYSRE